MKTLVKKLMPWIKRQAPATIVGLVLLTLVVSILYDIVVRPGLGAVGRIVASIVTFGSSTIRDAAYESAALNPVPVTGLLILFSIMGLFAWLVGVVSGFVASRNRKEEVEEAAGGVLLRSLSKASVVLVVVFVVSTIIAFTVHSQAVVIWRSFHADLAIVTPYLESSEEEDIRARFAAMEGKADYAVIERLLRQAATNASVELRDIDLW